MSSILVLTDGKAGHENQSRAFVRALGGEAEVLEVHFKSKFHKALSYLLDHLNVGSLGLAADPAALRSAVEKGGYAAVVGTGSGTFYFVKVVARLLGVKCGVVLYPRGYRIATFDCVLAPSFDRPAKAPNVIEIPANLVAADEEFYAKGVAAFRERYSGPTENAIAVIVGGPNKCSTMTVDWMKRQLDGIFADRRDAVCWVTTSRRTPPEVEKLINTYPWDYRLLYSQDHFNPIPAFVRLARTLYVTAESTGMLSEACTFGTAKVRVLDNLKPGDSKFLRFVENLRAVGHVDGCRKVDLSDQFAAAARRLQCA